ncbi:MAG: cadherin-like beta sandwich domain-containing protein, partial [Pseudomonas sp.]
MRRISLGQWLRAGVAVAALTVFNVAPAFALSNGCTAINNLSGSTALSFGANRYPASDFLPGDALTLTFSDSGAAFQGNPSAADSLSLARYSLAGFQTYNAANSTTSTPHTVSMTVPAGSLEANGAAIRATTSNGQISNLVFSCTSLSAVSTDTTLSSLKLSTGSLTPAFSTATTSYTASVGNATATLSLTPTTTDNNSTVTVNGTPVNSGSASPPIGLAVGANVFTLLITAADGVTTKSYTITVDRAQAAPLASAVTADLSANSTNNPISLAITGTTSSVAVATAASHGTATASGTSISYTPVAGYSGSDTFTYTATNSSGTSAPATVTVTVSQPTLIITPSAGALPAGQVGSSYSQTISSAGGTAPYGYAASGLPAGLSLNTTSGVLSGTPTTAGSYTPSVIVTDAYGATATTHYTLSIVAQAPVASAVSASVAANSTGNALPLNLSGGSADSAAIASQPQHGTATASGLALRYTPATGFAGVDSFSYTVTNAAGTSAPATVTITVTAVALALSPASGPLPGGTVASSYSTSLLASGG